MTDEELRMVAAILKVIVFPIVGFAAGFFAKWYLQDRKSRDELLRALATNRANAFQALWQRTVLADEIRVLKADAVVPGEILRSIDDSLLAWYYDHANALFLSWKSTKKLFVVLDLLRTDTVSKGLLDDALSDLRTSLKRDCGIYTAWNAWRQLPRPRRGETANSALNTDARQARSPRAG